ncbi:MAG TPA: response regulator [Desulfuromonadaceae bacterium]|jgi:DNA-binding NtrC family response regulator
MATIPTEPAPPGEIEIAPLPQRILIVDDEPAILFAYRKLIEKEGIAVDVCETHHEAIIHINARPYFAVIADMRLVGTDNMDGLKVVRAIREAQPDTKVILVTGYGNKEIVQKALSMGVSYYFEKPVMPAAILEALKILGEIG